MSDHPDQPTPEELAAFDRAAQDESDLADELAPYGEVMDAISEKLPRAAARLAIKGVVAGVNLAVHAAAGPGGAAVSQALANGVAKLAEAKLTEIDGGLRP